jgi:radical SAM family uncharacterized protein/radical SAM-linked protein
LKEKRNYRAELDEILPMVEKPARYTGGEWNAVRKPESEIRLRIALCFPDLYEIGMSHLGLKILYSILNERDGWVAERAFAPWPDMEAKLRERNLPLLTLESFTPLNEFDIVGFSLQYELTYTNLLTMLDLGRIPLKTSERTLEDPLVVAGGPTVYSCEPIADFIDVFLIGDGEEAFPELIERYAELRGEGLDRKEMLRRLARIEGMYVPSLYTTSVSPYHGLLVVDEPEDPTLPFPIRRRVVDDINRYPFPSNSPVPNIEAVHDRVAIEIARGCVDGCRFCQAGTIYRPVRERDPKQIIDTILDGIQKGGYDETSLTSLSTADYTCLEPLVRMLADELERRKVSFSVSSLRASGVSEELARQIARIRKTGFTIAPEAGTQRMRDVINKNITEDDVIKSCSVAFSEGWSAMKMYFMIGLPTETDEDVAGIAELGRKVRELGKEKFNKSVKVTCSASYFVPKPHTPFQWCAQEDINSIKRKQRMLRELGRRYGIEVKVHHAETSLLEGIISRGDRRLCRVIERAWRLGCRFDGWTEWFDFNKWMEAFKQEGLQIEPYLQEFPVREPGGQFVRLPWDHIDTLVKKEYLAREYIKGIKAKISPPCELPVKIINGRPTAIAPSHEEFERVASQPLLCYNCGLECDLSVSREHLKKAHDLHRQIRTYKERVAPLESVQIQPTLRRYRAVYSKLDPVKYMSHLDLTRALPRAFRRAGIRLGYSQGFHPMPLIQYGPALGVGNVGENELLDFDSPDDLDEAEFLARINAALPEGLRFKSLTRLEAGAQPLAKVINQAEYTIALDAPEIRAALERIRSCDAALTSFGDEQIHKKLVEAFMSRDEFLIERAHKEKKQKIDARRYTLCAEVLSDRLLRIVTEISTSGSVKPTEVAAAIYGLDARQMLSLSSKVRRLRLLGAGLAGEDAEVRALKDLAYAPTDQRPLARTA